MSKKSKDELSEIESIYHIERVDIDDVRAIDEFKNLSDDEAEILAESIFTYSLILNQILQNEK